MMRLEGALPSYYYSFQLISQSVVTTERPKTAANYIITSCIWLGNELPSNL